MLEVSATTAPGAVAPVTSRWNRARRRTAWRLQKVCSATGGPGLGSAAITGGMSETTILGQTGIEVPTMGYGAWSWGDSSGYWGYGKEYNKGDNLGAYKELMQSGAVMLDTAEVYGFGQSERYIGDFMQGAASQPFVASKFAPLPWSGIVLAWEGGVLLRRFSSDSVVDACKDSLSRLQLQQMGLYQIHWPGFLTQAFSNDEFLRGLAKCQTLGLTQAVGVSNFNERRLRRAVKILGESNVPLASNQVQYSLAYRLPERNGVLETCRELGVTLLAYSPIAQGLLTGKYRAGNLPTGPRGVLMSESRVREVQPLVALLEEIGQLNGGKTATQVALNWTICKGTLPIPGVKNQSQVQEALGALGWRMTDDQVAALDDLSDQLGTLKDGAPFEDW